MAGTHISTAEAAERLGVTRQRVLQLITKGRLQAEKFANIYIIREEDLKLVEDRAPGRPPKAQVEKQPGKKKGTK